MGVIFAGMPADHQALSLGLSSFQWLQIVAVVSGLLGVHLVLAIGGADMPVVVSLLNSILVGRLCGRVYARQQLVDCYWGLVGSSGAILSYIMCKAMNRSIANVVFGGFGEKICRRS